MAFIKVWCEYDIGGSFGGNNNEEVFDVGYKDASEIDILLKEKFEYLAEETESEGSLLDEGLMGWAWITVIELN